MTVATISGWSFAVDDAASPPVSTALEQVTDISGLGVTNDLVEHTNFDSPSDTKEFTAGLAEGDEFTVECNYVPSATGQEMVMTAVDSGATRAFLASYTKVSPDKTFSGSVVCLGYTPVPSVGDINKISFTFKITGAVTRA